MSFILDALKKSENDRQRQSGPALFEVKVAPPRTGLPLWAIAIVVLLGINLVIVAWMVFRHPAQQQAAAAPAGATPVAVAASGTAAPPASYGPPAPPPSNSPSQQQFAPSAGGPTAAQPGYPPQTGYMNQQPAQQPGSAQMMPTPPSSANNGFGARVSGPPPAGGANNGDPAAERLNPDDYEPATEPGAPTFNARVKRGTDSGVPLYQDVAAAPGAALPPLRLDLHVFAAKPQERFVMINMHKLREGDSLPEGVRVESITPEGAVLSRNGSRFLLTRD